MQNPLAPLIALVGRCEPFTAGDGRAFVRLPVYSSGGYYTLALRSRAFRDWFFHESYAQLSSLPSSREFHTLLDYLEAEARSDATRQRLEVYRRVGRRGAGRFPGQILLDLANTRGQFVEISPTGWKTTAGPGVLFQTSRSTVRLPVPDPPESPIHSRSGEPALQPLTPNPQSPIPALNALRSCLNLPSSAAWLRCLAWLLSAFRPDGPFPVLILQGPPGSGKSFAATVLRSLIDPSTSPLTPIPSSVRDLLTLARHNWVLAFDHISALSPQLADALCRLTSGLGATLRETSGPPPEPFQQYYKRPVLLTVTGRWSCPADLAERALTVTLPPIAEPRTEDSLAEVLNQAWPAILAALCSAVSAALSRTPHAAAPSGRCANALAWTMAAADALGHTREEIQQAFASPPPPHPMAEAVRNLLEQRRHWTGAATELLELLQPVVSCHTPIACKTPKCVSQQLKNCMLTLADYGIELKFKRLPGGNRVIDLREEVCDTSFEKSPPDASQNLDLFSQPAETEELKIS